jgi:S1-C subfamily serine protease
MSESDQTWNAGGEATGESAAPPPPQSWPQYVWPEANEPTAETPAQPGAESVSWPPTQLNPTPANPTPANPTPANPTPANPTPKDAYAAPGPYAAGPYGAGPYASGPYGAGPYASGPYGWPPAAPAPAPPGPTKAHRGLAALAALALVLASAGVGAGVAVAVHNKDDTRTFSSSNGSTSNTLPRGGFTIPGGGFSPNTGGSNNNNNSGGAGTLDMNAIAAKVDPALVNINTTLATGRAAGTGMLISSTGEIVTNNHVIADSTSITVVIGGTGPSHPAKVLGYDVSRDVALLQITDTVSDLPTISFGDPSKVQIGDPVVALGNALGQGGTPKASQGHVTALDQQVTAGDDQGSQETLNGMIQINAPIKPGDSGGALVDADGKVIGMNTAAAGDQQFNSQGSSIGFAIPIDNAVDIVKQIADGKESDTVHVGERAMLGVQVEDATGGSGAAIVGVQDNSGSADVGIKEGDVIIAVDGKTITNGAALREPLSHMHPGDSVSVGWLDSSNTRHDASVKLIVGPPL